MGQDCTTIERDLIEQVFGDRVFPAFPFKDEAWLGLFLNRDLHGLPGLPMVIFEALVSSLEAPEEMPLTFVPALTAMDGTDSLPCVEVSEWRSYVTLLGRSISALSTTFDQQGSQSCYGSIPGPY